MGMPCRAHTLLKCMKEAKMTTGEYSSLGGDALKSCLYSNPAFILDNTVATSTWLRQSEGRRCMSEREYREEFVAFCTAHACRRLSSGILRSNSNAEDVSVGPRQKRDQVRIPVSPGYLHTAGNMSTCTCAARPPLMQPCRRSRIPDRHRLSCAKVGRHACKQTLHAVTAAWLGTQMTVQPGTWEVL